MNETISTQGSSEISEEQRELNERTYRLLTELAENRLMAYDLLADDSKKIVDELTLLNEEQRAAKLEGLKEFAPRKVSSSEMHRRFERMFPGTIEWGGTRP